MSTIIATKERISLDKRLSATSFDPQAEPDKRFKQELCKTCPTKICTIACPAKLFEEAEDGTIVYTHEGCLECRTCDYVCHYFGNKGLIFGLPMGNFGVKYRFS